MLLAIVCFVGFRKEKLIKIHSSIRNKTKPYQICNPFIQTQQPQIFHPTTRYQTTNNINSATDVQTIQFS